MDKLHRIKRNGQRRERFPGSRLDRLQLLGTLCALKKGTCRGRSPGSPSDPEPGGGREAVSCGLPEQLPFPVGPPGRMPACYMP